MLWQSKSHDLKLTTKVSLGTKANIIYLDMNCPTSLKHRLGKVTLLNNSELDLQIFA